MVAAAVVLVLVTGDAVVERNLAGQATLREQLERPVNGGVADFRIFPLNQPVEFVGREMLSGFEEGTEYGVALGSLLQTNPLEMLVEDPLSLAYHFAGN
jgi:hypothetical protein